MMTLTHCLALALGVVLALAAVLAHHFAFGTLPLTLADLVVFMMPA